MTAENLFVILAIIEDSLKKSMEKSNIFNNQTS